MSRALPGPEEIERLLASDSARPYRTVREIAADLGLSAGRRPALRRLVGRLVDEGRLVAVRGRRFGTRKVLGDVVGRFTRHRAGFGFVAPDDPAQEDLFIPPGAQDGAVHGDVVAARVVDVKPDGRREGTILRVVERKSSSIVGMFQATYSGGGMIAPLDAGFDFEVLVPRAHAEGAHTGELVRVELEGAPPRGGPARGRVVERLGRPDEPGVDIEVLIRKYDLDPEFPAEVERAAEALPGNARDWPLDEREDFTRQIAVTIDGETAKDFDDAVSVERREAGGFRLHVHIADVGFFVRRDSEIDVEARRRGTSVYFPGRVVPMLPERLSNDLCSLRPDELRLTQGLTIEYDARGRVVGTSFHDGVIRSHARLTYTEVTRIVEERDAELRARAPRVTEMLDNAAALARLLAEVRAGRGAIDFDLPEPELLLALTGEMEGIVGRARQLSHRLIEEFMIAANEAVAVELVRRRQPALYRAHEKPPVDKLSRLAEDLSGLGYRVPEPFEDVTPRDLARLGEQAEGRPEQPLVQRLLLRSMALARYDAACLGHFGLALKRYLHFTSPIRRYPDLVAHRALRRLRRGTRASAGQLEDERARLPELARECSRLERDAESAERESIAWKIAAYMADKLGDEFRARVVDAASHGVTVAIDEPYVEGLIPIRRLGHEYFRYDERRRMLVGSQSGVTYKLGQELTVRLDRVDLMRHFLDFAPVGVEARSSERRRGRREDSGAGGRRGRAKRGQGESGAAKSKGRTKDAVGKSGKGGEKAGRTTSEKGKAKRAGGKTGKAKAKSATADRGAGKTGAGTRKKGKGKAEAAGGRKKSGRRDRSR